MATCEVSGDERDKSGPLAQSVHASRDEGCILAAGWSLLTHATILVRVAAINRSRGKMGVDVRC